MALRKRGAPRKGGGGSNPGGNYVNVPLRILLCNATIQPFFEYACNAWYPNINKKLKMNLSAAQNKHIRFCLKLNDRFSIKSKDFEKINWVPIHERVL